MFGHHFEGAKINIDVEPEIENAEEIEKMLDNLNEIIKPVFCRRCKQAFSFTEYRKEIK